MRSRTLVLESFGLCVELASDDPELLELVPAGLPGWSVRSPNGAAPSARFSVSRDGMVTRDGTEIAHVTSGSRVALAALAIKLRHHLALHAPDHVFVHAGVVAAHGIAIVLPGSSLTGKTTLVAALVRLGATYYSDEYAAIDREGTVYPYVRPLELRPKRSWTALHEPVPVPERLIGREPVRPGLIVVTSYEADATWSPARATVGEGAMALLGNAVPARSRPAQTLAAVRSAAGQSDILIGARGEALPAAAALLAEAERRRAPTL